MEPLPPKLTDIDPSLLTTVGGAVDRVCVSLRFSGDALVPEELTRLLGCEPTKARRKGDIIPDKRYHRVAHTGAWLLKGNKPETVDLNEQVLALLASVTDDLEIWRRLTTEFSADVFCGLFLDEGNRGFDLLPEVTRMLGERGITIDFDVYGP
jgi:hypothetical protein